MCLFFFVCVVLSIWTFARWQWIATIYMLYWWWRQFTTNSIIWWHLFLWWNCPDSICKWTIIQIPCHVHTYVHCIQNNSCHISKISHFLLSNGFSRQKLRYVALQRDVLIFMNFFTFIGYLVAKTDLKFFCLIKPSSSLINGTYG